MSWAKTLELLIFMWSMAKEFIKIFATKWNPSIFGNLEEVWELWIFFTLLDHPNWSSYRRSLLPEYISNSFSVIHCIACGHSQIISVVIVIIILPLFLLLFFHHYSATFSTAAFSSASISYHYSSLSSPIPSFPTPIPAALFQFFTQILPSTPRR